jgi:hypothetical protein
VKWFKSDPAKGKALFLPGGVPTDSHLIRFLKAHLMIPSLIGVA